MKTLRWIVLFATTMVLITGCSSTARVASSATAEEVQRIIESGNYRIDVNMASPRRTRNIPLTSSYWVEVRNDSVFSNLPYYGRAYAIPYGGGQGLQFEAPIQQYGVNYTNKGNAKITFRAKTPEDTYQYSITVFPNGGASLQVNMQQRESIGYSGELNTQR